MSNHFHAVLVILTILCGMHLCVGELSYEMLTHVYVCFAKESLCSGVTVAW